MNTKAFGILREYHVRRRVGHYSSICMPISITRSGGTA